MNKKELVRLGYYVVPPELGFWDYSYIVGVKHVEGFGYIIVVDMATRRYAKKRMSDAEIRLTNPELLGFVIENYIQMCIDALEEKKNE